MLNWNRNRLPLQRVDDLYHSDENFHHEDGYHVDVVLDRYVQHDYSSPLKINRAVHRFEQDV